MGGFHLGDSGIIHERWSLAMGIALIAGRSGRNARTALVRGACAAGAGTGANRRPPRNVFQFIRAVPCLGVFRVPLSMFRGV